MKTVETIVAYYKDENHLKWFYDLKKNPPSKSNINYKFTLYEKDDSLKKHMDHRVLDDGKVKICNLGRCDYAFLFHIVKNYDNLSDYNVFVKTHWKIQNIPFAEMFGKAHEFDYLDAGGFRKYHIWDRALIDDEVKIKEFMRQYNVHPLDIERLYLDYLMDDKLGCITVFMVP